MRPERPGQSWEEPHGSLDTDPTESAGGTSLAGQCSCTVTCSCPSCPNLPWLADKSLLFPGSFGFGFSQGRGQAGLQCLTASLALQSKRGTREWATFTTLTILRGSWRCLNG